MAYKILADPATPPIGAMIMVEVMRSSGMTNIEVSWMNDSKGSTNVCLVNESGSPIGHSSNDINRYFARVADINLYGGNDARERTEVDHWLSYAIGPLECHRSIKDSLDYLERALMMKTWLASKKFTIADIAVFSALYNKDGFKDDNKYPNINRWYKLILSLPVVKAALTVVEKNRISVKEGSAHNGLQVNDENKAKTTRKQEGKFIELPGAEMGKVVVRFPPEASGYLHIGHAKAALLNQYYADNFQGQLIMRFDDTNPAKENVEFEQAILEDLKMLEIKPDRFTHSSDYFDVMLEYCTKLIKDNKAFVDDTPAHIMKEQREQRLPSANRENTIEKNLQLWEEMKKGSDKGQECCVRAKIDFQSTNGCMRDPTIYRCKPEPHPRTGTKYKVYPTYDFACPIVDAIEGVTHTLRTTEYHDRDVQFYWLIEALGLRRPHIWEYSRLNMTNTVLSKRKLTWFVTEGLVDGWDDPRFPTVRGILRRGMTVEGLKQFIIAQGSSRSVVFMEWDKIWAFNKKVIDPVATRYTALEFDKTVPVNVQGAVAEWLTVQNHPKDPSKGTKQIQVGPKILIEKEDAESLVEGQNATFINWGNLMICKVKKENNVVVGVDAKLNIDDKNYKNTLKLTWLCADGKDESIKNSSVFTPCYTVYFDHIISKPVLGKDDDFKDFIAKDTRREVKMLGETALKRVAEGEIIQLQRKGFFRCDVPYASASLYSGCEQPLVLFHIPDGHTVTPTVTGQTPATTTSTAKQSTKDELNYNIVELNEKITVQGNKIRDLKASKAEKAAVESEVKILLDLKAQYKAATGSDWKPGATPKLPDVKKQDNSSTVSGSNDVEVLNSQIIEQGDKVRKLKSEKAGKATIDQEVKILLELKNKYKTATGKDWKPDLQPSKSTSNKNETVNHIDISNQIKKQGDTVRELKTAKADKATIDREVKELLRLKAEYKSVTGSDWKPEASPPKSVADKTTGIHEEIVRQGDKVRQLKSAKANKTTIEQEVKVLLELKSKYKEATGEEWKPSSTSNAKDNKTSESSPAPAKKNPKKAEKTVKETPVKDSDGGKTGTRLGLEAKKNENLSEWYSQVITKGEMIEYYDVSGCYILRPWSFAIWDVIKDFIDDEIKKLGVQNCYFPIFVSRAVLEREKDHVADFAPEVAWVTKSGDSDLAEPIAIRPTSETVMYPAYAKWLKSHRDLPLKLNQWNNVVRWEFKHPQPFLRTREFLWQEGHSAFATKAEADEEVLTILEIYAKIYEEFLAVPVVRGRKTEKEKFAGGDYTTTVEAFVSASGRGIQGATSHHLGQNFSKMFDIQVEGAEEGGEKTFVYQNSWGLTTRTIGVMIMVHGDDKGLVLPPKVAAIQAVIVPCGITASTTLEQRQHLLSECAKLEKELNKDAILRIKGDYRENYSPGWKFNHWELKGVPIRVELGPKDLEKKQVTFVRRDTSQRLTTSRNDVFKSASKLLQEIQENLLTRATADLNSHIIETNDWNEFCTQLDSKNMILSPFCGEISCEDTIKASSVREDAGEEPGAPSMGAKSLCIPFEQPKTAKQLHDTKCINPNCLNKPKFYTLFGRSY
ncbi:bifunctional glutamate/proline--tRNA ligase [Orussus abietinus]|uniref:bifunctional glutamate/proline--tRNA ligase n=1 Tax=Orussus abietinus TaxID=222816 RepID=UPI00062670E5|nr:bifunctional glutamate/proline--tRNA ligase [Orussus abietinus]